MTRAWRLPMFAVALFALLSIAAQRETSSEANSRVFSVRSAAFGATGDGAADDTAAIQQAIDAASASGGTVYFPAGVYRTTKELMVRAQHVSLRGDGPDLSTLRIEQSADIGVSFDGARLASTMALAADLEVGSRTLRMAPGAAGALKANAWLLLEDGAPYNGAFLTRIAAVEADTVTLDEASPVAIAAASAKAYAYDDQGLVEGVSVSGLAFESAEGASAHHAALLMIRRAYRAVVENCQFRRSTGPLLELVDSRAALIERSLFEEAATVAGTGIEGLRCTACSVVNSEVRASPFGIVFSQSPYTHIAQNIVSGRQPGATNGRGIKVQNGSAFSRVVDNTITDAGLFAIYSSDSADVLISNNTIFGTGTGPLEHGIQVGGFLDAAAARNVVANNIVAHVAGDGIAINPTGGRAQALQALVSGNQVHDAGGHGIQVVASGNLVTGNLVTTYGKSGVRADPGTHGNAIVANQIGAASRGAAIDVADPESQTNTANRVEPAGLMNGRH